MRRRRTCHELNFCSKSTDQGKRELRQTPKAKRPIKDETIEMEPATWKFDVDTETLMISFIEKITKDHKDEFIEAVDKCHRLMDKKAGLRRINTPGTAGGPGGRDRTLAVKSRKNARKSFFFCIYLLVMPKYWGKQIFTHMSFPEVGQKQKTEKKERNKEERETQGW